MVGGDDKVASGENKLWKLKVSDFAAHFLDRIYWRPLNIQPRAESQPRGSPGRRSGADKVN